MSQFSTLSTRSNLNALSRYFELGIDEAVEPDALDNDGRVADVAVSQDLEACSEASF